MPVSLIPSEQPLDVVSESSVERVAKELIASLKVFIGSFISEQQVIVVSLQPVYKETTEPGEQGHGDR